MAAPLSNNHLSFIQQPLLAHQDVTFDWDGALSIDHPIDIGLRSISLAAKSFFVPSGITIRALEIQLFVLDPEGEVNCLGNLQCERFLTNAAVCYVNNFLKMNGAPVTDDTRNRFQIFGRVSKFDFSNP